MNKKFITSIGVVLLTTGVIGGIWSGIYAMPKVISDIQTEQEKYNKPEVIYSSKFNMSKLNLKTNNSNIIIKKYDGEDVVVEKKGNNNYITIEENENELIINEEYKINNKVANNIDGIVENFINELYVPRYSQIIVYIPNNIDIEIESSDRYLRIEDSVILDNLTFKTNGGYIYIDNESKIKNLDINANYLSLQVAELYCAENVNINADWININNDINISKYGKIPESINIYTNNYFSIDVDMPLAKNLKINSNDIVELELPILDYKFNFDINTSNGINVYSDSTYDKISNKKNFVGFINENLDNDEEYIIKIKSDEIILK